MSEPVKRLMVSPAQAADMLSVNRETVLGWVRTGKLSASRLSRRIIRIRVADIEAMLNQTAA